jgi:hypothetical protein
MKLVVGAKSVALMFSRWIQFDTSQVPGNLRIVLRDLVVNALTIDAKANGLLGPNVSKRLIGTPF